MSFPAACGAGFANAQVRVPSGAEPHTRPAAAPWEKPTEIFSQISSKRSSETTQGPAR
jgi:hypothetical protein